MLDDIMYYTYSFGSGVHRSHIGRLSIENERIVMQEFGYFENEDVFIKNINGKIYVEYGFPKEVFNTWTKFESLGYLESKEIDNIVIVKDEGHETKLEVYAEVEFNGKTYRPTEKYLTELVEKKIREMKPDYKSELNLNLKVVEISDLWESLKIQIFNIYNEDSVNIPSLGWIYYDNAVFPMGSTFGGMHLLSTVIADDKLYYSYSTGSGFHLVAIGVISAVNNKLTYFEDSVFIRKGAGCLDLYLRNENNNVIVETRKYNPETKKTEIATVGKLKIKNKQLLVIVKDDGKEIVPESAKKQQTQPKSE
ncbi:MAG: hypothetical protein K8S87_11665 [Planctomycetes bacterium]|nr:hypothetical protein [Planctomycetota bacterium]